MAINYISLSFGYVESGTVASMLMQNHTKELFINSSEALKSLALFFLEKWKDEHEYSEEVEDCCTKALATKPKPPKFCPECGKKTDKPKFNVEDYEQWLGDQLNQTADSWGGYEGDWWPWGNLEGMIKDVGKGNCVLQVLEHAAEFLTAALDPEKAPAYWRGPLKEWQENWIKFNSLNRLGEKGYNLDQILNHDPSLKVIRG